MKRIKFKIATWDEGWKFMKEIAQELGTRVINQDAAELIRTEGAEIYCFPDDGGSAFITCKLHNSSLEPLITEYRLKYTKK